MLHLEGGYSFPSVKMRRASLSVSSWPLHAPVGECDQSLANETLNLERTQEWGASHLTDIVTQVTFLAFRIMDLYHFPGSVVSKIHVSKSNQSCDPSGTQYIFFWLTYPELDSFAFNWYYSKYITILCIYLLLTASNMNSILKLT